LFFDPAVDPIASSFEIIAKIDREKAGARVVLLKSVEVSLPEGIGLFAPERIRDAQLVLAVLDLQLVDFRGKLCSPCRHVVSRVPVSLFLKLPDLMIGSLELLAQKSEPVADWLWRGHATGRDVIVQCGHAGMNPRGIPRSRRIQLT